MQLHPSFAHEVDSPRRLALPIEGGACPYLQHRRRDRQRLEEFLVEPLQELEFLQALELRQVLHRPAARARQPRPGRRCVFTVQHRSPLLAAYPRTLYTLSGEGLQDHNPPPASST